jgi:hypothetical protein
MTPAPALFDTIVVLPTYRRSGPLVWSLASVLRQAEAGPGTHRVVVVNNDEATEPVKRAIAAAHAEVPETRWIIEVIHRRPTMDPVLSWYGAVAEASHAGDAVFLHGDDDLMLPGSIRTRTRMLVDSGAACLLSASAAGLVFDGAEANRALVPYINGGGGAATVRPLRASDLGSFGGAFIGNHSYRAGDVFAACYREALGWLKTLPLEGAQQLAMLPYLLPIAFADRRALVGTHFLGCIRGQSAHEIIGRPGGQTNWMPGLLYAACLQLLRTGPLRGREDLEALREDLDRLRHVWYVPTALSREARRQLSALAPGPIDFRRRWGTIMRGALLALRAKTGTQGLRYRWRLHAPMVGRAEALRNLQNRS